MLYLKSRIATNRLIALALVSVVVIGFVAVIAVVNPFGAKKAAAASVTTCSRTGTVDVNGKTYEAQNNLWNSAATGQQCISVDNNSGAFTVTTNANNLSNGAPASYPSIYKGCHWGDCTNNSNLPIQESNIASVNSSWSISTASGDWDSAYDIWFNQTPTTTGQPNGTEVMIWINHNGPPQPFGSQTGTASINGSNWAVWTGRQTSWNIISYVDTTPTTSVNFDLKNFFTDATARGSIQSSWYLIDVEAGFELWQNGAGMTNSAFSVSPVANGGGPTPTPTSTPRAGTPTPTPTTAAGTPTPTPVRNTPTPPPPTSTPSSGGNGVTASGVVASNSPWFGEEDLKFSNTSSITVLTATIVVQKTAGVTFSSAYATFGGVTMTHADNGSTITYTFTLNSGQSVSPGSYLAAAQFSGTGTAHSTTGDTWSITTTSGGKTNTSSGHF
jgi:hypothetical protein